MQMDLLIESRFRSAAAYMASEGANVMSEPEVSETTLVQLLEMVTKCRLTLSVYSSRDGEDVVISHWNDIALEIVRTTVTCDRADHEEVLRVLKAAAGVPAS